MEGSTGGASENDSPMLTEPHRGASGVSVAILDLTPSVALEGAGSQQALEFASRQRWARPVKGRQRGAHVVAQLHSSSKHAGAASMAAKSAGQCEQAGGRQNCTPPQLERTASHMHTCESASAFAKEVHKTLNVPFTASRQGAEQPHTAGVRRRGSRSLGAAMVASFVPQRSPEFSSSTRDPVSQPAADPGPPVHNSAPSQPPGQPIDTGPETNTSQAGTVTTSVPHPSVPNAFSTAPCPEKPVSAVAPVQPLQTANSEISTSNATASIVAKTTVAHERSPRAAHDAAVKPVVCVAPSAVASTSTQGHQAAPIAPVSTASDPQCQSLQSGLPVASQLAEPPAVETPRNKSILSPVAAKNTESNLSGHNGSPTSSWLPAGSAMPPCRRTLKLSEAASGDAHVQHASSPASKSTAKSARKPSSKRHQQGRGNRAQHAYTSASGDADVSEASGTASASENDPLMQPTSSCPASSSLEPVPHSAAVGTDMSAHALPVAPADGAVGTASAAVVDADQDASVVPPMVVPRASDADISLAVAAEQEGTPHESNPCKGSSINKEAIPQSYAIGANTRAVSTSRHRAGRRAAALCTSPMSSRETTREEPAKSGGEGSLQTLADGSGIMGHGICRAATSDAGDDDTTSPGMTPPPQTNQPNDCKASGRTQHRRRGRGELVCAAVTAAAAAAAGAPTRTADAATAAHASVPKPKDTEADAVVAQHDSCVNSPRTPLEGDNGLLFEVKRQHVEHATAVQCMHGSEASKALCQKEASAAQQQSVQQVEHEPAGSITPQEFILEQEDQDGGPKQTTPTLNSNSAATSSSHPRVSTEPLASSEKQAGGCEDADMIDLDHEVDAAAAEQCGAVCMHTVDAVAGDSAAGEGSDVTQKQQDKVLARGGSPVPGSEEQISQQIARFSLKRRTTELSPMADVPAGDLRGALEDTLFMNGDLGAKRARVSAGMAAVSHGMHGGTTPGSAQPDSDGGGSKQTTQHTKQPSSQQSKPILQRRASSASKGLRAVAAAAAALSVHEQHATTSKDSAQRVVQHESAVEASLPGREESESPCTGPSNRTSLDDTQEGDSGDEPCLDGPPKLYSPTTSHAPGFPCPHTAPTNSANIEQRPVQQTGSPDKPPPIATRVAKVPCANSFEHGTISGTEGGAGGATESPRVCCQQQANSTQSNSRSLLSPGFSSGTRSQTRSQCLHDPVSAVLADATSAFLASEDRVVGKARLPCEARNDEIHRMTPVYAQPEESPGYHEAPAGGFATAVATASAVVPSRRTVVGAFFKILGHAAVENSEECIAAMHDTASVDMHGTEVTPEIVLRPTQLIDGATTASLSGVTDVDTVATASLLGGSSMCGGSEWPQGGHLSSASPLGRCSLPSMFPETGEVDPTPEEHASAVASPSPRDKVAAGQTEKGLPLNSVSTGDQEMRQSSSPEASAENIDPTTEGATHAAHAAARSSQSPELLQGITGDSTESTGARNYSPPVAFGPSPTPGGATYPSEGTSASIVAPPDASADDSSEGTPRKACGAAAASRSLPSAATPDQQQQVVPDSPPQTPQTTGSQVSPPMDPHCSLHPLLGFDDLSTDSPQLSAPAESAAPPSPLSIPLVDTCMHGDNVCDVIHETPDSPCTSEATDNSTGQANGTSQLHVLMSERAAAARTTPTSGSTAHVVNTAQQAGGNRSGGVGVTNTQSENACMPCIAADEDISGSPDVDQCSPPKLPSCSPSAHPGNYASPGGGAALDFSTTSVLVSPGETPELYNATAAAAGAGTSGDCNLNWDATADDQQCATLSSPRLSALQCDPKCVPRNSQRTMKVSQEAPAATDVQGGPVQSAVCLSEHPPGVFSPAQCMHDPDVGKVCSVKNGRGTCPERSGNSPALTPPSGMSAGSYKASRGSRGHLLHAAAVSTNSAPALSNPTGTPPLHSPHSTDERGSPNFDKPPTAHHSKTTSPGSSHARSRPHSFTNPGPNTTSRSPIRHPPLSSPLRHPKIVGSSPAALQPQSLTPPTASAAARSSPSAGSPTMAKDARAFNFGGASGAALPSPLSPLTASQQHPMSPGSARATHSAGAVAAAMSNSPLTMHGERSAEELSGSGTTGTGNGTPPQHIPKRRMTIRRRSVSGVSATLGVSATQISARTAAGTSPGLAAGARRRPTGGRLAPAAGNTAPGLGTLRTAFLDLQLANEASRGADWSTLTSSGVPLPDPLDISVMSANLVMQAAAAATNNTAADITAAVEDAQEEWTHLRKARISCWLRMSLIGPTSGTPSPPHLHHNDISCQPQPNGIIPGSNTINADGEILQQGQQRRSSLKRSPLPRVCVVPQPLPEAPQACNATNSDIPEHSGTPQDPCITPRMSISPALPLFRTNTAGGVGVAAGGSNGDRSCPGSDGDASAVSLDSWGADDEQDEFGAPNHKRRRSVRFSEQANVKRYEGMHEPSRVRGEPEVTQAVSVRSPVKCQVAVRKERRGWWSAGRSQNMATGGLCAQGSTRDEEIEEGEVVESGVGDTGVAVGDDAPPGNDVKVHAGGGSMHAGGDVENESPVTGVLKMSARNGPQLGGNRGGFGGDFTSSGVHGPRSHSLQVVAEQAEELVRLGREPMQEDDGPPGDVNGSSEVLVGAGL